MQMSHNISSVSAKCDNQVDQLKNKLLVMEENMSELSTTPAPIQQARVFRKFPQKLKFWPKITVLVSNQKIGPKSILW